MHKKIKAAVNITGAGIGGLASAIRLASQGYAVTVFEKNSYPGGKLSEMRLGNYRFDKGPSLLTMPWLIDELTRIAGSTTPFTYTRLNTITHYFFEDGTTVNANENINAFARELSEKLNEDEKAVVSHLKKSAFYYDTVGDLFMSQSLHRLRNFISLKTLKGLWRMPRLNLLKTMHAQNSSAFRNEKTVQIFNRYATYNGSDPYKAPALLNIIPHLEFGLGAYIPTQGMHQVTEHLYRLALEKNVTFKFDHAVEKIVVENDRATGVMSKGAFYKSDIVISDADMTHVYDKLLPPHYRPAKLLAQERSSSAYVFYWGIKKEFEELGLHNILFSDNYKEEFRCLFESDAPYHDPTVYINITAKYCKADAPEGCGNWFVMVNAPHNRSHAAITYAAELRRSVISKINRILKTDIESFIEAEAVLDPHGIEVQTSSFGGSLYGNASNNRFSAFLRHANCSSIKNLYFAGGSVHPGGGIPLCLLSGKIVADMIIKANG